MISRVPPSSEKGSEEFRRQAGTEAGPRLGVISEGYKKANLETDQPGKQGSAAPEASAASGIAGLGGV